MVENSLKGREKKREVRREQLKYVRSSLSHVRANKDYFPTCLPALIASYETYMEELESLLNSSKDWQNGRQKR